MDLIVGSFNKYTWANETMKKKWQKDKGYKIR